MAVRPVGLRIRLRQRRFQVLGGEAVLLARFGGSADEYAARRRVDVDRLPKQRLAAFMDGLRERGLVHTDGRFTDAGPEPTLCIETLTNELAAAPYDALSPAELDELVAEPRTHRRDLVAAGSQ